MQRDAPNPPSPAATAPDADGAARVLVCDDSGTMRALMRSLLSPRYEVVLAKTAEEALALARERAPDVVLSDLILPGMSGSELCRAFHADLALAAVPFVLVTTLTDSDARAFGLEAGADDYLYKPIRERELLARVASLVRLRRTLLAFERRGAELERTNVALRRAQDAVVRAGKLAAVGALAAGLAHEINNPLAYIKAGAAALGDALADVWDATAGVLGAPGAPEAAEVKERVRAALSEAVSVASEMAEGSRRLERLAADLRAVSWPASPTEELVSPAEAVDAAWTLVRGRYGALPTLERAFAAVPPIRCSEALVSQALLPVLERAVAAAGPGGRVAIALAAVPGGVEIAVRDSGPPIPGDDLSRVFDPFFVERPGGTTAGLGLSVAHGIAHGLGGDIRASTSPAGTTFYIRLPERAGAFET